MGELFVVILIYLIIYLWIVLIVHLLLLIENLVLLLYELDLLYCLDTSLLHIEIIIIVDQVYYETRLDNFPFIYL